MQTKLVLTVLLSGALFLPAQAFCRQSGDTPARTTDKSKTSKKTASTTQPTAQEVANAKSQGLVWVNLSTRVYYKGGDFYGKTKQGKFLTEEDARKEGFHEAQTAAESKKYVPRPQGDQSGLDATKETHSSTPPQPK